MSWQTLGSIAPADLAPVRKQLHCVLQVVAMAPGRLLEPRADWSHTSFSWENARHSLVSELLPLPEPCHVALRPADGAVLLLDGDQSEVASVATGGGTIEQLQSWLVGQLRARGAELNGPLQPPDELPEPCSTGQSFGLSDRAACAEIGRYYQDAFDILTSVVGSQSAATPIRTWPHHMDMALLLELDRGGDPETARSISFGMQPGDDFLPEPYFYSSPWPYPRPQVWPPLAAGGSWNTDGFTAAVLPSSVVVARGDGAAQQQALATFALSAIEANHLLLSSQPD